MPRVVLPELLDELDPRDPDAIHSRRDLRRLNAIMANACWIMRATTQTGIQPQSIAELGAGDGTFLLKVVQRFRRVGICFQRVYLVDLQPVVSEATVQAFRAEGCLVEVIKADVITGDLPGVDLIVCNLFLHHFEGDRLQTLLTKAASRCKAFVACETRRCRFAPPVTRLLWLIGCNRVTCHDAEISVKAGFWDGELSGLWPEKSWTKHEGAAGLFSHIFWASRRS